MLTGPGTAGVAANAKNNPVNSPANNQDAAAVENTSGLRLAPTEASGPALFGPLDNNQAALSNQTPLSSQTQRHNQSSLLPANSNLAPRVESQYRAGTDELNSATLPPNQPSGNAITLKQDATRSPISNSAVVSSRHTAASCARRTPSQRAARQLGQHAFV